MLDGFDFTIFLLIMLPIANELGVSVTAVASVLTVTLCCASLEPSVPGGLAIGLAASRPCGYLPLEKKICHESATPGHPPVASLPAPLHGGNIGLICAVIAG